MTCQEMYFPKKLKSKKIVKKLKIGSKYLVPCVNVPACNDHPDILDGQLPKKMSIVTPIIGNVHSDEIGIFVNTQRHLHVDMRFVPEEDFPYLYNKTFDSNLVKANTLKILDVTLPSIENEVFWIHRICQRIGLPNFFRQRLDLQQEHLQKAFKNRKLLWNKEHKCWQCPHQGFMLGGQPIINNVVGCLGHGLHFDVKTRKVVSILDCS